MAGDLGCEVQRMGFRCGHEVFNSGFGSFRVVDSFPLEISPGIWTLAQG